MYVNLLGDDGVVHRPSVTRWSWEYLERHLAIGSNYCVDTMCHEYVTTLTRDPVTCVVCLARGDRDAR